MSGSPCCLGWDEQTHENKTFQFSLSFLTILRGIPTANWSPVPSGVLYGRGRSRPVWMRGEGCGKVCTEDRSGFLSLQSAGLAVLRASVQGIKVTWTALSLHRLLHAAKTQSRVSILHVLFWSPLFYFFHFCRFFTVFLDPCTCFSGIHVNRSVLSNCASSFL